MTIKLTGNTDDMVKRFKKFHDEFLALTEQYPLNNLERCWMGCACLEIRFLNNRVRLSSIRVGQRGRGYGNACLTWLLVLTDRYGLDVELTPCPFGEDTATPKEFKAAKARLQTWYERYGFSVMDATCTLMVRKSKLNPQQ